MIDVLWTVNAELRRDIAGIVTKKKLQLHK